MKHTLLSLLLCLLSLNLCAQDIVCWGDTAKHWQCIYPQASYGELPRKLTVPKARIFVMSQLYTPWRYSPEEVQTLRNYVEQGGILVLDMATVCLFTNPKDTFDMEAGAPILGRHKYIYWSGKPRFTDLGIKIIGKKLTGLELSKDAISGVNGRGNMVPLVLIGNTGIQLGVNRIGKGCLVYTSRWPNASPQYTQLLKKLLDTVADEKLRDQFFPTPIIAEGNALVTLNGKKHHLYVDGDPLIVRAIRDRLTRALGIKDFDKRFDSTPQIRVHVVNFREFKPEAAKRAKEITYPYGYAMDFDGKTFTIIAKNYQGQCYAATDFLRRFCTYRKFGGYPDAVLHRPPYALPASVHQVFAPDVPSLTVAWGGDAHFDRNVRITIMSTHSLWKVLPPEKFVASHPEYYPWINGQRRLPSTDPKSGYYHGVWQPCLMNKDLVKLTMDYADRYFKNNPDNLSLPLGVNDGGGSCHCPGCEELMRTYNNQYIPYYNAVAQAVAEKYPGKMVSFIAYGEAAPVPKNIKLHPNLLVEVANGIGPQDCHRLDAWKKAGARNFGAYQYYNTIGGGYTVPQYFPRQVGKLWKQAYKDYHIQSVWMELYPKTWIFAAPRQYVLCSLAWDMSQDIDALLDEFFAIVYGKADKDIKALFDIFEKRHRFLYNDLRQIEAYTTQDLKDMDRLLTQAEQRQLDPKHLENLHTLKTLLGYVRPHILVAGAFNDLKTSKDPQRIVKLAEQITQACNQLEQLTMSQEDAAKIFVDNAGRPNVNGLKGLKNQSAVNLPSYAEQRLDTIFSTMKLDWAAMRKQTQDPVLKALYGTQICKTHPHSQVNLLSNPSFEQLNKKGQKAQAAAPSDQLPFEAMGWRYWAFPNSKCKLFLDSREKHSGKLSAAIGLNRLGASLIADFGVKAGCRYRISFWVKASQREHLSATSEVRFLNGKQGFIDDGSPVRVSCPQSAIGHWAKVSLSFTPLKGAESAMLLLGAPYQDAESTIWFDDVSIEEIYRPICHGELAALEAGWSEGVFIDDAPGSEKDFPQLHNAIRFARGKYRLYLGPKSQNPETIGIRIGFKVNKGLPLGAFKVSTKLNVITVEGGDEGLRCGLYDVMEKLGCTYIAPKKFRIGYVPIRVRATDLNYAKTPRFTYRGMHICGGKAHHDPEVAQWMSFHKMNRRLCSFGEVRYQYKDLKRLGLHADTTVHTYYELIPDKKYFKEHPEFFALVGGKRIPQGAGGQLCLSNKAMRREFVKNVLAIAKELPQITEIGLCPNDGYGHCQCPECRKLDTPEDAKNGMVNARIADFLSEVCREVAKADPTIRLGHFCYSNFSDFLRHMPTVPSNLKISMTQFRCLKHTLDEACCQLNRSGWERLNKAVTKTRNINLYEYFTYMWETLPAPFAPVFYKDLQNYEKLGINGLLSEIGHADSPTWQNYDYPVLATMKWLYDGSLTPDEMLKRYCQARFIGASDAAFDYFKAWEQQLQDIPGCIRKTENTLDDVRRLMTPDFLKKADRLLKAVEKKVWGSCRQEAKQLRKQLDDWTHMVLERKKYELPAVIKPLTWEQFQQDVTPEDKGLPLLEKVTIIPPKEAPGTLWVYDSPDQIGMILKAQEPMIEEVRKKVATIGNSLDAIYYNDNAEFFFAPSTESKKLWHFIISVGGKHVASECQGKDWNWSWKHNMKTAISLTKDGYVLKAIFPKADFKIPAGHAWAFTVIRNRFKPRWIMSGTPAGGAFFSPSQYLLVKP